MPPVTEQEPDGPTTASHRWGMGKRPRTGSMSTTPSRWPTTPPSSANDGPEGLRTG